MAFLNILGVTEIDSFKLVLEGKAGKEISFQQTKLNHLIGELAALFTHAACLATFFHIN